MLVIFVRFGDYCFAERAHGPSKISTTSREYRLAPSATFTVPAPQPAGALARAPEQMSRHLAPRILCDCGAPCWLVGRFSRCGHAGPVATHAGVRREQGFSGEGSHLPGLRIAVSKATAFSPDRGGFRSISEGGLLCSVILGHAYHLNASISHSRRILSVRGAPRSSCDTLAS